MKQKILFTDLLKFHSDSEIKLKIYNKYICNREPYIYFKNIDFNYFNFKNDTAQAIVNLSLKAARD